MTKAYNKKSLTLRRRVLQHSMQKKNQRQKNEPPISSSHEEKNMRALTIHAEANPL
jgi:hypothetical protein